MAKKLESNEDKQKAFVEAYLETDEALDTANIKYSGTTAVSALIIEENGKRVLYTANVGDARIVLGYFTFSQIIKFYFFAFIFIFIKFSVVQAKESD